jgi:hypothetical protein
MHQNTSYDGFVVKAIKKPRLVKSKHYPELMKMPELGGLYYVTNSYENKWGTRKLVCIDQSGETYFLNQKGVEKINDTESFNVKHALKMWVSKDFIPVIFKPGKFGKNTESAEVEFVSNSKQGKVWIALKLLRNDEGTELTRSLVKTNKYQSANVQLWYAKKLGLVAG